MRYELMEWEEKEENKIALLTLLCVRVRVIEFDADAW